MGRFHRQWGLAALLACLAAAPAVAQQSVHHMEQCTRWGYIDASGRFGTSNTCDQPVQISFMTKGNQRAVTSVLKPGEVFDTGLSRAQIDAGWWMFTTCPAGYTSSIPFTPVNRDSLVASTYQCVAAGR
jgi:hypothetical protein